MKEYEKDLERISKLRRDFEARALAIRRNDDLTDFGKDKRLRALDVELRMRLKRIDSSNK